MLDNDIEKIPILSELMDEVFEDTQAFAKDITSSINMMPLAAFGTLCLSGLTYWFYFHILNTDTFLNQVIGWIAIGCWLFASIIILHRYQTLKRKYSQLFELRKKWEEIKEI